MTDLYVQTWDELNQQLFADTWNPELQRFRSRFVFRGLSDAAHGLATSLMRLGGAAPDVEGHLLRNFRKYASQSAVAFDSVWNWLAVAQHHGLPTRLLDWTFSPYIAAHFATQSLDTFDRDAAIWCVDFGNTNATLPAALRRLLEAECADMFTVEILDQAANTLQEFDRIAKKPFVAFFEPPSMEGRIVNQYALFSAMSSPSADLGDWLAGKPGAYTRIVIPAALKWEIRDKLDLLNINERLLFPGLDGLSQWLKRYYTPRA